MTLNKHTDVARMNLQLDAYLQPCKGEGGLACSPSLRHSLPAQKFVRAIYGVNHESPYRCQCTPSAAAMPGQRERSRVPIELHVRKKRSK